MFKERTFLPHVALLIVLISCSPLISGAQVNDTVTISPASNSPTVVEISNADALEHAQRNLDRSLSILNMVATLLGVLVALLTLLVVIGAACGFIELRRWREFKDQAEKSAEHAQKYAAEACRLAHDHTSPTDEDLQ